MDTIGDFLTTIRNAGKAQLASVTVQWSKMNASIASILKNEGYVGDYAETTDDKEHKALAIRLKYINGKSAITGIERHSKPGCRLYYRSSEIPQVLDGMGISILTTSKGVLRDKDARRMGAGGELICKVW